MANVITIVSIFILGSFWGIYGLAVGSFLGILGQFLIQLPSAYKHGLRFRFEIDFSCRGSGSSWARLSLR
ncbi:MAG: lipid II flippase MurJ [Desulfitobacteriaceae bacterium]